MTLSHGNHREIMPENGMNEESFCKKIWTRSLPLCKAPSRCQVMPVRRTTSYGCRKKVLKVILRGQHPCPVVSAHETDCCHIDNGF